MTTTIRLEDIEQLAETYASQHQALETCISMLEEEVTAVKKRHLDDIRRGAHQAHAAAEALKEAIEAAPELFEKPRTRVFHGIKVGYQKGKGRLVWDNEAHVVKRIKDLYVDEIGVLITTSERPNRAALAELPAAELKRLGVRLEDTDDQVVIRSSDSEVDKLVKALLSDESLNAAEAA